MVISDWFKGKVAKDGKLADKVKTHVYALGVGLLHSFYNMWHHIKGVVNIRQETSYIKSWGKNVSKVEWREAVREEFIHLFTHLSGILPQESFDKVENQNLPIYLNSLYMKTMKYISLTSKSSSWIDQGKFTVHNYLKLKKIYLLVVLETVGPVITNQIQIMCLVGKLFRE